MSLPVKLFNVEVLTDSIAGQMIALRKGCGKVRHLDIRQLYIQSITGSGRVRILKCRGGDNIADMGTKPLTKVLIDKYKEMLGSRKPAFQEVAEIGASQFSLGGHVRKALAGLVTALLMQPAATTSEVAHLDRHREAAVTISFWS